MNDKPICVFDSGLGGLTVVREIRAAMPQEDIIYLGDSARVPYGTKSIETVQRFAIEDAAFLMRFDPKIMVAACNTASAAAITVLREKFDIEIIDMIQPGAAAAAQATDKTIGVIATEATISSGAYQREIEKIAPGRKVVCASCPLLVPIVEEGRAQDDPIVLHVLGDYLRELQRIRPGALILGCTHYPLLESAIAKLMGPDVALINSGRAASQQVLAALTINDQRNPYNIDGMLKCFTTDNPGRFKKLAARFGGRKVDSVEFVGTDELELLKT